MAAGQIRHVAPHGATQEWIFEDTASPRRWWIASAQSAARPVFGERATIGELAPNSLRQLVASSDGRWLAGVASDASGQTLWRIAADGTSAERVHTASALAFPAWAPTGEIACTINVEDRWRLSLPCGQREVIFTPDIDVLGPMTIDPGAAVFFASPNADGMVDLWTGDVERRVARRVTSFARDTYAPSAAADGTVLFKVQSYRTSVAELDLATRTFQQVSTLQAETPSYHPGGRTIAVTYGTWRRLLDDAKYPDIAQEIGVLPSAPAAGPVDAPLEVIAASDSEDQAMTWSPNGRWIVLHSHREQSDDIWLRPADQHVPDRRLSFLGRGAEVGWPRWSPDGRWVLFDGASPTTGRSVMFVIGIDQETGNVTAPSREVAVSGVDGEITHGEWLPDSATIVAIAKLAPGRHAIVVVPAGGGEARAIHRFESEHDFPGVASSPDGRLVAFVGPAPDGFFQIFTLPLTGPVSNPEAGGPPAQVTVDRTHKSQPAWSPDGRRLAYTVWSYEAQFWTLRP